MTQCQNIAKKTIQDRNGPYFRANIFGQPENPPLVLKYSWVQSECATSDKSYESMLRAKNNFQSNMIPNEPDLGRKFLSTLA